MNYVILSGNEALDSIQAQWNELWEQSSATNPNVRLENLRSACEQFFGGHVELHCIFAGDRLVAGLPLVKGSFRGMAVETLPNNEWGNWGDLLVSPVKESTEAVERLAIELVSRSKGIIEFRYVDEDEPRWAEMLKCVRRERNVVRAGVMQVGIVRHAESTDAFYGGLSRSFRKKLRKYHRELEKSGEVTFELQRNPADEELEILLEEIFELESRGWKGRQNSSMREQNMDSFFSVQARLLRDAGCLAIGTLRLDGRLIAFEFGSLSKTVYSSWKIGYDESLSRLAPGHVIADYMVKTFHGPVDCRTQDTIGPLSDATSRWTCHSIERARYFVAGNSLVARAALTLMMVARSARNAAKSLTIA